MVDHIYCINLERSVDRRRNAQEQFEREGLDVEFFKASDGKLMAPENIFISKSEWGCADSHVRIWRDIISNEYETALVFEDDITLSTDFVPKLDQILQELPPDWDFVNIGADSTLSISLRKHSKNIHVGKSLLTHAYLIRLTCARKWAGMDPAHLKDGGVDSFIANYPSNNLFVSEPIARQKAALVSTIGWSRTHDYSFWVHKLSLVIIAVLVLLVLYFLRR